MYSLTCLRRPPRVLPSTASFCVAEQSSGGVAGFLYPCISLVGTQAALTSYLSNAAMNVGVQTSSQGANPVTRKLSLDLT